MNAFSAMPLEMADLGFRLSEGSLSAAEAQPLYDWVALSTENRTAFTELLLLFSHLEWERCASKLVPNVGNFAADAGGECIADESRRNCQPTPPTCAETAPTQGTLPAHGLGNRSTALRNRKSLRAKIALTLGIGAIYYGFWVVLFWGIGQGGELAPLEFGSDASVALVHWHETVAEYHRDTRRPLERSAKLLLEPGSKGRTTFNGEIGQGRSAPELAIDGSVEPAYGLYSGQRVELTVGRAVVRFNSGTRVSFVAPATFDITHDNAGMLQHGRLVATVPPDARGFAIDTRTLHIVDLGTEFGVATHGDGNGDGKDEVHVFRGEVQVGRCGKTSAATPPMTLSAGQSVAIDGTSATLIEQAASPQAFADISASLIPGPPKAKTAPESTSVKLLALYTLDGDARDASTNDRHANAVANVQFEEGYEGQAAYFSGTPDSHIDLPLDASADTHPELTLGAWVKLPQAPKRRMEILSSDDQGYDRVLTLDERRGTAPDGDPQFAALAGPAVGVLRYNGPPPAVDRWTFVAVTYRQPLGLVMLYVEDPSLAKGQGGLRTEFTGSADIGPSHRRLRVGGHHDGSEMFHGAIDNVFVFAGALSHKQLEAIRTGGAAAILEYAGTTNSTVQSTFNFR